jgi:SecD/SecF fusion protein
MKMPLRLGIVACTFLSLLSCGTSSTQTTTSQRNEVARITLRATCFSDQSNCDLNGRLQSAIDILARRASAAGYRDVVVHVGSEAQTVVVEEPRAADSQHLVPLLTSRGQLLFIDTGSKSLPVGTDVTGLLCTRSCSPHQYQIQFTGSDLDTSAVASELDSYTQQPVVAFQFKGDAQQRFADYTAANIGNYLTITLDSKVIEAAVIQSQITGPGQISGSMTMAQATALAAQLASGELPLMMTLVNVEQVTPTATK